MQRGENRAGGFFGQSVAQTVKLFSFLSFLPKESACLLPNIETFLNPCICDGSANEAIVHTECRTPLELSPTIERVMFISLLQSLNLSGDWALYQSL